MASEPGNKTAVGPQDPDDLNLPGLDGEDEDEKKPDISARIFFIVIGVFVVIFIAAGVFIFLNVFNNATGLGEMPVYEGSKAVTAPKNPFTSMETELKARKVKGDFLVALTSDDITKVQTFYNTQMKAKKYEQVAASAPPAGQIFGQFKSFGGSKVIVYNMKDREKEFYFLIANPVTAANVGQLTAELKFSGPPPKVGDTLIMLAKVG